MYLEISMKKAILIWILKRKEGFKWTIVIADEKYKWIKMQNQEHRC